MSKLFPVATALWVMLALNGCRPSPPEEKPIETVDVTTPGTFDPDADPKRLDPGARLRGSLPAGFPADLPLHLPATVVDGGQAEDGAWVLLETPASAARVRQQLGARLRAAGWDGTIDGDAGTFTDDDRTLDVALIAAEEGPTRYRVAYR